MSRRAPSCVAGVAGRLDGARRAVAADHERADGQEQLVDEAAAEELAVERRAALEQQQPAAERLAHVREHRGRLVARGDAVDGAAGGGERRGAFGGRAVREVEDGLEVAAAEEAVVEREIAGVGERGGDRQARLASADAQRLESVVVEARRVAAGAQRARAGEHDVGVDAQLAQQPPVRRRSEAALAALDHRLAIDGRDHVDDHVGPIGGRLGEFEGGVVRCVAGGVHRVESATARSRGASAAALAVTPRRWRRRGRPVRPRARRRPRTSR